MNKVVTNPDELVSGREYMVQTAFKAEFWYSSSSGRLYFTTTDSLVVAVHPEYLSSALEVETVHPLWPPVAGEIWENPDGERYFARQTVSGRAYLHAAQIGRLTEPGHQTGIGWRPVFTERNDA